MKDKFSLYQADGFWGIIEDASDEKQTSVKSYIGPDLIVKRLNEQAKQIEELNQRLVSKDKYIDELENDLNWERGNKLTIHKQFADRNCYVTLEDYKADIAEKDKEIEELKLKLDIRAMSLQNINTERIESERSQTQLAIQELEKVKVNLKDRITMMSNEEHSYLQKVVIWYDICNQVNNQIKELKGEKDVED